MAAPKLDKDGRRLVIERIISGDTNRQICAKLVDAGYPTLTDATLSTYRAHKEVQEAISRKDSEAVQSGYAQRSERILKLAKSLQRFEKRLADGVDDTDFKLRARDVYPLVALHREYRETLQDMGNLVDPKQATHLKVTDGEGKPLVPNLTVIDVAVMSDDDLRRQLHHVRKVVDAIGKPASKPRSEDEGSTDGDGAAD